MLNKRGFFICILLLSILSLTIVCCYSLQRSPLLISEKQWYLENNGDSQTIEDSPEYKEYIFMEKGIDIQAEKMWELLGKNDLDTEVIVAIIDTGIDVNHSALKDSIWINENETYDGIDNDANGYIDDVNGYNFCEDDTLPSLESQQKQDGRHGTMCAGVIAAEKKSRGITGIAGNANVKIMSLKVLNDSDLVENNRNTITNIINAIVYAEKNGARVCNISLSTSKNNKKLYETMRQSNILFVVAAGNGPSRGINIDKVPSYPASYPLDNMITVANLNYNGKLNKHMIVLPQREYQVTSII